MQTSFSSFLLFSSLCLSLVACGHIKSDKHQKTPSDVRGEAVELQGLKEAAWLDEGHERRCRGIHEFFQAFLEQRMSGLLFTPERCLDWSSEKRIEYNYEATLTSGEQKKKIGLFAGPNRFYFYHCNPIPNVNAQDSCSQQSIPGDDTPYQSEDASYLALHPAIRDLGPTLKRYILATQTKNHAYGLPLDEFVSLWTERLGKEGVLPLRYKIKAEDGSEVSKNITLRLELSPDQTDAKKGKLKILNLPDEVFAQELLRCKDSACLSAASLTYAFAGIKFQILHRSASGSEFYSVNWLLPDPRHGSVPD